MISGFPGPRRPREGIPVHVRLSAEGRWSRGHVTWAGDVLTFRGGLLSRNSALFRVATIRERVPTLEERWWIHRHGGDTVLATLALDGGGTVDVAARRSCLAVLLSHVRLPTCG